MSNAVVTDAYHPFDGYSTERAAQGYNG